MFRHFVPSRWLPPPCAAKAAIPCGHAASKFESEELNFMEQANRNLKEIYVMEAVFIFLGMVIGIVIGQQYYKHQIVKKKNKKVISQVKEWLEEAEE